MSCEKDTDVTANLTWNDVTYFDLNDGWKACIYEEAINFLNADDYTKTALETKDVKVGDATVVFTISIKSYQNYTVVVYNDLDSNGKYDEGENASVKFDGVDAGEAKSFDLTVNY